MKKPTRREMAMMQQTRQDAKREHQAQLRQMIQDQDRQNRIAAGRYDPLNPQALAPEPGPPSGFGNPGWKP